MEWEAYLRPEALPEYVAAAAMVALALWLVWLDPRRVPNLAFALFLVSRASSTVSFTFERLAPSLDSTMLWERARAAFTIATVLSLLLFASVYPRPRARTGRVVATVFGLLVVIEAMFLMWPASWATYQVEAGGLSHAAVGPLFVFQLLRVPVFGLAVLVFIRDWTKTSSGPGASAMLLVALAFGLHASYDVAHSAVLLFTHGVNFPFWTRLELVLDVLTFVPVAAAALLLARHRSRRSVPERTSVARALAILPLPIATVALVQVLVWSGLEPTQGPTSLFFLGVWRLSLPLIATFALVRYGLFDVEVRIKRTIQRAIVAILFVLVFFALSEGAEELFAVHAGPVFAVLTAAVLSFLLTPLQRFADRIADAAMPTVTSVHDLTLEQRRLLYRELVRSAWSSGGVSADEKRLLEVAQGHLGLGDKEAARIAAELETPKPRPMPRPHRRHRRR